MKCPGQNPQNWKPEDIFEVKCSFCDEMIEFWKDELFRNCTHCKKRNLNPKINIGCAEWCPHGEECLKKFKK